MGEIHELSPETWLDDHGDYLYRYAYVRLGSKAVAEDVVQETFLAAWKGRERFNGSVPARYWMLGILKHKVVDHLRKSSRETSLDAIETEGQRDSFLLKAFGITTANPPSWRFNPRKAFEQEEFWGVFYECLSQLKGNYHQVFALRELEGLSTKEICKDLDITPNNLWVILHRARNQLKVCLEAKWKNQ